MPPVRIKTRAKGGTQMSASTPQNALIIAETSICQDSNGRYCLNDLHRAAGAEERHSPNRWTRTESYTSLVSELTPETAFAPSASIRGGIKPGTYVCKELVYAYAMWISPAFSLKVIRAYDAMASAPAFDPMHALSDPAMMRSLLLGYTEKVIVLEERVSALAPKARAFELFEVADGVVNLQTAGKMLGQQPNKFIQKLRECGWIYKRAGAKSNSAHVAKINAGYLEIKPYNYKKQDGTMCVSDQVMVTPKGLARLSMILGLILGDARI